MQCEIIYSSNKIGQLKSSVVVYLKTKNFDLFKSRLLRGSIPSETRFTLRYSDDLSEINKSVIEFYRDLQTITDRLAADNPDNIPTINQLLSQIETEFHIDADETQSASIESDLEVKTSQEEYDKNRNNLQEHLKEIYGVESYDILMTLDQEFYDSIMEAAYHNSKTGESVDINNDTLNKNITKLKQAYLYKIKTYLQDNGIPFTDSFYGIQQAFYKYIKSLDGFKQQLNHFQSQKIQQINQKSKTDLFEKLIEILQEDPQFKTKVVNKLNQYKKDRLSRALYAGDCYSSSYLAVRKYILEYRPDLKSKLDEIEAPSINLLEATNAYSILSHFDEMLKDKVGKQISIQQGTEGLEISDKYSYHQDTAHEIKGWQTSEDIGSEKHMSRFAKGVMSQIRIFDHKTDEYKNRRLDGTSFIIAARHLIDDIVYGNINVTGDADYIKKCRDLLIHSVATFHNDPQTNFQRILQLLFDVTEGLNSKKPLKEALTNKRLLTDHDLDILYSVYLKVFNLNDPTSFISQEISGQFNNVLGSGLMQEIAAMVDSNITMDYLETTTDWETGEVSLKVKKKYFNNAQLYKLRKSINSESNNKSLNARKALQDQYELEVYEPTKNTTNYQVKVGDSIITLEVPNTLQAKILTSGDKRASVKFSDASLFDDLDSVDLINFRQKLELGSLLTDKELKLKSVLKFLDDYLNLNTLTQLGLNTLQVYKSTYSEINGMKHYLMPLVQLAMRAAYINNQYIKAEESGKTLAQYLENDSVYKFYKDHKNSKIFVETFGNIKYTTVSFADKALDMWVDAISMLTGEASKATTKDGQGNSIPNNSVGKLGGILHYYLHKQKGTNCDSLMFVDNPGAIKSTFHDLEASNIHGDTKAIKQFSCGELFFHSIFNKFWGSYNKTGNVIIQPTVYSDKTTFLNWEISSKLRNGVDLLSDPDYVSKILKEYTLSLGTFYENTYQDTINKLNTLTQFYNQQKGTTLTYKEFLKKHDEKSLMQVLRLYNADNPNNKIDLEKDKDYRTKSKVIKTTNNLGETVEQEVKYCTINEILEYNARVYNDESLLAEALEQEKYNFLQNLIDYNASFQVINFQDDIAYYTSSKINEKASSKTPILSTILNHLKNPEDRIKFFNEWVDNKTGKLILAKQGNRDILGVGKDFIKNEPGMILNPFLDKFFYVEGLFSNNLRMSLTGSEVNHPDKAKGVLFNKVKSTSNFVDFNKITGLGLNNEQYIEVKTILDKCDDVSDLANYDNPVIKQIYDKSIIKIINTAQGTQFKRNVIIPATLQYCQQGTKNGVSKKIKCAVIYDEKAPVNNYRGETGKVDSADGSAQINPFQSILENLSLGSQAVGFIKKPIWHSYDTNGGTAFLAKFATDTITNESMKASMHSSTSLFKMFKQMTNLQWTEPIDLTKPIHMHTSLSEDASVSHLYDNWFQKIILEGQKLFYENKYGEKTQILKFNKTTTADGKVYYYTVEQTGLGTPTKVYHMFDGQSNHYTFDSYQKAQAFETSNLQDNHTIKSLFELHTALGGIYCVDSQGNSSEFNNKVVVNFMNNIGTRREGVPKNAIVNQANYYQPLKEYHIGYALNNTAVKNGAKNINDAESWKGDTKLQYFEVDSDGLGMQMNADHDIVDSELTEFSQVIAATSAYGYTYDNCDEIFKGLAKTALQASKQVLDSVDQFLAQMDSDKRLEAQSALYDAIGRIVLTERSIKDKESLTGIISEAVLKIFNKNKNHTDDDVKLPFSDSNIYSEFIATLASSITKASIKRKHPGSGCVMVPGYNMITYFEIGDKKYSHRDILKKSREDLRQDLYKILKETPEYNSENDTYKDKPLKAMSLQVLLQHVGGFDETVLALSNVQDNVTFNNLIVDRYLEKLQAEAPVFTDRSYFQPEDVVQIITPTGDVEQTIVLDTMEKYYAFKDRIDLEGTTYRIDIKTPRNLKPSLIRWKYLDETGVERYMNIFDHPVIKNTFKLKGKLDANYRKQVQQIFNDLHKGIFSINGVAYNIVSGSLENTEAELVMSNIYKDIFGVDSESLQEILEKGENYFVDQIEHKIQTPVNKIYDVALLKDNGKHTLIKFGEVVPSEYCVENTFSNISVQEEVHKATGRVSYPIYCMKGNKPLFKIGEYVNLSGDEASDLYINNGNIVSKSGKIIDEKQYRINGLTIQKRIDFVKRYKLTTKQVNKKTGQEYWSTNVMYKLINKDDLVKLYGGGDKAESDAHKQIGSLITKIYQQDNYKFIELNPLKGEKHLNQIQTIRGYFGWFLQNDFVNPDHKLYLQEQLDSIQKAPGKNFQYLSQLKKEFYKKEAHKKWVSFQDSLKFISSRIPAQTLQSFMTMKCVGWTENTKNMAYVSHFQIYLQGSDYDIDKAYIMGQSYDGNGQYIQWSPLFDFTDEITLSLSKQLPVSEPLVLNKVEGGVNITSELRTLLEDTDDKLEPLSYDQRLATLKAKISVLKKINKNNGNISYNLAESPKLKKVFDMLYSHIQYTIPENIAEAAYKNVASANIYAVSHDVRNRDQGYTAISMDILQKAASNSPKGEQAATLNMLNPLTKYVMQYQNLVGKNVISIAANGEKVWFNAYYYWTKLLKEGRTKNLQFQTTLSRVANRAGSKAKDLSQLQTKTKNHLPDLNPYDEQLKNALFNNFGADLTTEEYAYVDQLISQLLSAATDNAKELILAKINSGNNFARMYVYLIMTGYNFDDIVSFMISPASEFIDSMSNANMFSDSDLKNSPHRAISLAQGIVKFYNFLHGNITEYVIDETNGDTVAKSQKKFKYVFDRLRNSKFINEAKQALNLEEDEDVENLDTLMKGFILASMQNPEIDITTLIKTKDTEINTYLQYCQNIAYKLSDVASQYSSIYEMQEDVKEFRKIYNLSSEISSIASAWLGLNQGLPTDELGLLKRFQSMRKVVIERENALEIYPSKMFTDSQDPKAIEKAKKYFDRVVDNIIDNNEMLSRDVVEQKLKEANEKGLIGTFDIYRYLTDNQYRKDMIEYNHIIKGTLNVLDMMEEIPHYKEIINCLKALAVSKQTLASKSRLINKLIQDSDLEYLSDQQLKGIIRYVDKLNAFNFAKSITDPIVLNTTIEGFDSYFNKNKTDKIDLSTLDGIATFKHWIEYEFLEDLKQNYSTNPLVKHLQRIPENQRDILATDIDLLNPNTTSVTRLGYNEIIRGMAQFEKVYYKDSGYTIADLFQLYNILVNNNQYGGERLTTAFKACSNPNSILNKFFKFVADQDYDYNTLQDYELLDYYINAAPIVSTGAERFRTEKFIKVNDPVEGYILKRYNEASNSYETYSMIPAKDGIESNEHRLQRLQNFAEFCPFEMPEMSRTVEMFKAFEFEGEITPEILDRIKNILLDFSSIGKLIAFKDC